MRAIAVTSAERSPSLPDVPSVAESLPGFQMNSWLGMAAPGGTPPAVTHKLQRVVARILANPENQKKIAAYGGKVMTQNGEQVVAMIRSESLVWASFAKDAGVQKE